MENHNEVYKEESKYIFPCIGGLFALPVTTIICRTFELCESTWGSFMLAIIFALVGAFSMFLGAELKSRVFGLVLIFSPVGVIVNAVLDSYVWNYGHNLFPIEMIFVPVMAFLPLLIGIIIGEKIRPDKKSNLNE